MRHPEPKYMEMITYGVALANIVMNPGPFAELAEQVRKMFQCKWCGYSHMPGRKDLCGW